MTDIVYERSAKLLEAELGQELLALDPQQGLCFGFNEVAAEVWRLLETPRSAGDLTDDLLERFDVEREQCLEELRELLDELEGQGLIRKHRA